MTEPNVLKTAGGQRLFWLYRSRTQKLLQGAGAFRGLELRQGLVLKYQDPILCQTLDRLIEVRELSLVKAGDDYDTSIYTWGD